MENWKPVLDWEGLYEVSDHGHVRSIRRKTRSGWRGGNYVTGYIRHDGYWEVSLHGGDRPRRKCFIHHLVLEAFDRRRPEGQEALHGEGGKLDCSLGNLKWGTREQNLNDRVRDHQTNRGERQWAHKLTWDDACEIRKLIEAKVPQNQIAVQFGVCKQTITLIKQHKTWAYPPQLW